MQEVTYEQELFMSICQTVFDSPHVIRAQCETVQDLSCEQLPQAKFDVVVMNYSPSDDDDDDDEIDQPKLISLNVSEEVHEVVSTKTDDKKPSKCILMCTMLLNHNLVCSCRSSTSL